jgi:hypothetical protein
VSDSAFDGASLVARINDLQAKFQRFAEIHPWVCLATKNEERSLVPALGQLTDGRWPPMFYPLVSPPKNPHLVPVLDQVWQLTTQAGELLEAVLNGPNGLPGTLIHDIRDWDSEDLLLMRGGWIRLLWYVVRSQHVYVFPNYPQVAATALSYLASKVDSSRPFANQELWIPVSKAVVWAEKCGHNISVKWLSKDAVKHGVRLRPSKGGRAKKEVEWGSLSVYLLKQQLLTRDDGATESEARERIKKASADKKKAHPLG